MERKKKIEGFGLQSVIMRVLDWYNTYTLTDNFQILQLSDIDYDCPHFVKKKQDSGDGIIIHC